MKSKSINYVMKHACMPGRTRKFHKANCVDMALMAGQGVNGYKVIWFREGDGKKFGCKNDQYFQQTCGKMGYHAVKIK